MSAGGTAAVVVLAAVASAVDVDGPTAAGSDVTAARLCRSSSSCRDIRIACAHNGQLYDSLPAGKTLTIANSGSMLGSIPPKSPPSPPPPPNAAISISPSPDPPAAAEAAKAPPSDARMGDEAIISDSRCGPGGIETMWLSHCRVKSGDREASRSEHTSYHRSDMPRQTCPAQPRSPSPRRQTR